MFWTVSLHVLRENEEATEFYLQRGFRVVRLVTGHYQIDDKPRDAYLMEFKLDRASKTSLLMSQLYRLCRK